MIDLNKYVGDFKRKFDGFNPTYPLLRKCYPELTAASINNVISLIKGEPIAVEATPRCNEIKCHST